MKSDLRAVQRMPDAFVILFFVILIAGAMTFVVRPGAFSTETVAVGETGDERTPVRKRWKGSTLM